nr:serine hydrolase domain-containing protein [Pedobacter kyonggii]
MKIFFKLTVIFVLAATSVLAQNLEPKIDSLLNNLFKDKNGPGGVFMIAKGGVPIYRKAFGKANLELAFDMTPENVFQLGSLTKQFTAVAILLLEAQGKLNTADPIAEYIPDYPFGDEITIHHLLTHTSGIADFTKMKSLPQIAQQDLTPKQVVDFFKNEPRIFKPGEKFEYNNAGYVILGYVIELVSGLSYENFITKNIFEKAGMISSRYASDIAIIKHRAYGYQKKEIGYQNKKNISFNIPFSAGSLMSTVDDMLKWQNVLNQNLILNVAVLNKAFKKYKLINGDNIDYGYGWHLKEINGIAVREHGGSIFGFKTMSVYFPKEDILAIGLSNCDCNSPTQVTRDIAFLVLGARRINKK